MRKTIQIIACIVITMLLSSCYTVRIKTMQGEGVPDPLSTTPGPFENIQKIEIDTTINMKLTDEDFIYIIKECESGGVYMLEYKNSLSSIMLAAITFGRKRKVKITYSCNLTQN